MKILLPLLLLVGLAAEDLMHFEPGDAPEPRELLAAADFTKRAAKLAGKDGWQLPGADTPTRPAFGLQIRQVQPGSSAADAGVEVGDVIVALGGQGLSTYQASRWLWQRAQQGQEWTIWSPERGLYRFTDEKPQPGMSYGDAWLPHHGYSARHPDDPEGIRLLAIAARAAIRDPDLAETALARCRARGIDDPACSDIQQQLLAGRSRYGEALIAGLAGLFRYDQQPLVGDGRTHLAWRVGAMALAEMKLPVLQQLVRSYPEAFPYDVAAVGRSIQAVEALAVERSPLAAAADLAEQDLTRRIRGLRGRRLGLAKSFAMGKRQRLFAEAGFYETITCGPPLGDCRWSLAFTLASGGGNDPRWARALTLRLVGADNGREALEIVCLHDDGLRIDTGPFTYHLPHDIVPRDRKEATITVVRVGGLVEVLLNEERVCLAPLLTAEPLAFNIHACGIQTFLSDLSWTALGDQEVDLTGYPDQVVEAAKPKEPAPPPPPVAPAPKF